LLLYGKKGDYQLDKRVHLPMLDEMPI